MADQFDREDVVAVADCLGDDSAQLRQENDEDERADNMDRAASMLTWMLLTHPAYASGVALPRTDKLVEAVAKAIYSQWGAAPGLRRMGRRWQFAESRRRPQDGSPCA